MVGTLSGAPMPSLRTTRTQYKEESDINGPCITGPFNVEACNPCQINEIGSTGLSFKSYGSAASNRTVKHRFDGW
jgi:hypothetical protein